VVDLFVTLSQVFFDFLVKPG